MSDTSESHPLARRAHPLHRGTEIVGLQTDHRHDSSGRLLVPGSLARDPELLPRGFVLLPPRSDELLAELPVILCLAWEKWRDESDNTHDRLLSLEA